MNQLNINCKKCGKSFDRGEQMSLYKNEYYHNTCFQCNFCDCSLVGQSFYTRPDGSFQCQRCHLYHAPKCFICNNSIADGVKYNIYQGKHFHKDCFKCNRCLYIIPEGRQFHDTPNGFFCTECFKAPKAVSTKGDKCNLDKEQHHSAEMTVPGRELLCAKCIRPIPPNVIYGKYENKQYHVECFVCNRCSKNLVNTVCRRLGSAIVCKDCS